MPGIPRYLFYYTFKKDFGRGRHVPKKDWRLTGASWLKQGQARSKWVGKRESRQLPAIADTFAPASPVWLLGMRWVCQAAYKANIGVSPRARLHVSAEWRKRRQQVKADGRTLEGKGK